MGRFYILWIFLRRQDFDGVITRNNATKKADKKEGGTLDGMMICSGGMVDVGTVPEEIKILPLGHVHSQKGEFDVDDESVALIQKRFKDRKVDLVIDYEHQTLKDVQAPAGGWIEDIYKGEDAVIAKVRWTDRAKEYIKNREYRYLSPVVMVREADKKAVSLHSAALTNTPAIDGMFALANSIDIENLNDVKEDTQMDLKKLAALLGLPETATEEDIEKAIKAAKAPDKDEGEGERKEDGDVKGAVPVANSVVLSLLGLKDDAKTEDVATAIMELKAGNGNNEILALKEELEKRAADDLVQSALKEGKITAAQKEWAKAYALSDKEGFKSFMEKAPAVVPVKKMDLKDAPEGSKEEYDTMILKNCGISQEDARKYFKEEIDG